MFLMITRLLCRPNPKWLFTCGIALYDAKEINHINVGRDYKLKLFKQKDDIDISILTEAIKNRHVLRAMIKDVYFRTF